MANSIFHSLNGGAAPMSAPPAAPMNAPMSAPMQAVTNAMNNLPKLTGLFNSFRAGFQGNPQAIVQQLLNSGRMSPEQFDQLSQAATAFQQQAGIR